ncbi:MAG TPA: hypothetical protein VMJ10_00720 [Kofleriaceae bacterium]|nr:hypothetical protein [Kofleriaceae bacterium]
MRIVLETSEVDGVMLCIMGELLMHEDGTITGSGTLRAQGAGRLAFAATGGYTELIESTQREANALARG